MKFKNSVLLGVAGFALTGCATVMNGPNVDYLVNSEPNGAHVTFSGSDVPCETPCERELRRENHVRIDIAHEGYKPVYVLVQSKMGGATVGNVLAGGIVGVLVDSGNGSNRFLSPRPLIVRLARTGTADEAVLLNDDGEVISTVAAHNDEVRPRVAEQLGATAAGVN